MTTKIGINGFGRIGRDYLRFILDAPDLDVVAINDVTDSATLARLLRHDQFGARVDAVLPADLEGLRERHRARPGQVHRTVPVDRAL